MREGDDDLSSICIFVLLSLSRVYRSHFSFLFSLIIIRDGKKGFLSNENKTIYRPYVKPDRVTSVSPNATILYIFFIQYR